MRDPSEDDPPRRESKSVDGNESVEDTWEVFDQHADPKSDGSDLDDTSQLGSGPADDLGETIETSRPETARPETAQVDELSETIPTSQPDPSSTSQPDPKKPEELGETIATSNEDALDRTSLSQPPDGLSSTVASVGPDAMGAPDPGRFDDGARPKSVGGYPIVGELGRGGMGVVYLAVDPRLNRKVALKVLTGTGRTDRAAFERLEREAQTLAAIVHPNIATIYSLEDDAGTLFFTMEWISGGALDDRIKSGTIELEEALDIGRQIARALHSAHERGVVHRDLKPSNVLLTQDGDVKIVDFGIAAAYRAGLGLEGPSAISEMSGTPRYMSPEQWSGEAVDPGTDIWAFGCLLYECLTGASAFGGKNLEECRTQVFDGEPDWSKLDAHPKALVDLVRSAVTRKRTERLPDAASARRVLDDLIARAAVPVAPETPTAEISHNLPRALSKFIGRTQQLDALEAQLADSALVTLTGTGGCGKSRLGQEAVRRVLSEYPSGAWYTELASISHGEDVAPHLASVMKLQESDEPIERIVAKLESETALIMFDNCEHVLDSCSDLTAVILERCPNVTVLASSREALGVDGEFVFHVPSLQVPEEHDAFDLEELAKVESIALFVDRASAARRGFELRVEDAPAIIQICRRLDGIPLALELAASRAKALPVAQIAKRLDQRFKLLRGGSKGAAQHQKTLQAAIDWSYDLLTDEPKTVLNRLSVFSGGFTLEGAERVVADDHIEDWEVLDHISDLIDKSLVEFVATDLEDGPRYRLLETIREYSKEKLEAAGETDDARERHRDFFVEFVERSELIGPEQGEWVARLSLERDNLRLALETLLEGESQAALDFTQRLGRFWHITGRWREGRDRIDSVLKTFPAEPQLERVECTSWAARFAGLIGDFDSATRHANSALDLARKLGDPALVATIENDLGVLARQRKDYDTARGHYLESARLREELGDSRGRAIALHNLGNVELESGDLEAADRVLSESRAILEATGDLQAQAITTNAAAGVALMRKEFDRAKALYETVLELCRSTGNRGTERSVLTNLGLVEFQRSRFAEAIPYLEESLLVRRQLDDRKGAIPTLVTLAIAKVSVGDLSGAAANAGLALSECRELRLGQRESLEATALVLHASGEADQSTRIFGAAVAARALRAVQVDDLDGIVDRRVQALREELGPRFEALFEEGREKSDAFIPAAERILQGL